LPRDKKCGKKRNHPEQSGPVPASGRAFNGINAAIAQVSFCTAIGMRWGPIRCSKLLPLFAFVEKHSFIYIHFHPFSPEFDFPGNLIFPVIFECRLSV